MDTFPDAAVKESLAPDPETEALADLCELGRDADGCVDAAVATGVGAAATAVGTGSVAIPKVTPKTITETIAVR